MRFRYWIVAMIFGWISLAIVDHNSLFTLMPVSFAGLGLFLQWAEYRIDRTENNG